MLYQPVGWDAFTLAQIKCCSILIVLHQFSSSHSSVRAVRSGELHVLWACASLGLHTHRRGQSESCGHLASRFGIDLAQCITSVVVADA